jgi:hypothetical protein
MKICKEFKPKKSSRKMACVAPYNNEMIIFYREMHTMLEGGINVTNSATSPA